MGCSKEKMDSENRFDHKIQSWFWSDQIIRLCSSKSFSWLEKLQDYDYDPSRRVDFRNKNVKLVQKIKKTFASFNTHTNICCCCWLFFM